MIAWGEVGNSGGGAIMPAVANETTFSVNPFGKGIVNNSNHCLSPLYFYDKSSHLNLGWVGYAIINLVS